MPRKCMRHGTHMNETPQKKKDGTLHLLFLLLPMESAEFSKGRGGVGGVVLPLLKWWVVYIFHKIHSCVWLIARVFFWIESKRLVHTCDRTHSCVWRDSFMCVTWLIYVCDMTRPRETRLIFWVWVSLQEHILCVSLSHVLCVSLSHICVKIIGPW